MNIFIMILVVMFMAGFYMMQSPNQRNIPTETEYAISHADMRAIAQCAAAAHQATIKGTDFTDICTEQNEIVSKYVCLDAKSAITACTVTRGKKPAYSFIITATNQIPDTDYNNMLEILEQYYADAGTFGLYMDGKIISGGSVSKSPVPKGIIDNMGLSDGQLVYFTQYEIPDETTEFDDPMAADINCPAGTVKTYRFGRWQCVGYNTKTNCAGDMIWDSDLLECVPDESRKPLCAEKQTAVMVDDVWECINPFPDKTCPDNMVARLNYNTLEWECIEDPTNTPTTKKCANIVTGAVYGGAGATLRVPTASSCTDCEKMVTDPDTCITVCIPDATKINDPKCYPGASRECSGTSRAFYFGFPSQTYAANVSDVDGQIIPLDSVHSQNRKFNCLDCGTREIDKSKSFPPYIAVCK